MEGHCSTGQSPQWAVMPMEEDEYAAEVLFCLLRVSYRSIFLTMTNWTQ